MCDGLVNGFILCSSPENLLLCFLGVVIGTFIGVLPGIGPMGTMAILMPLTFRATPVGSFIMLAGIYYGAMYGGSTTSILVNIPGEVSSVVTCLDGHQMALQGKAGRALGIAAFGSLIGGIISTVGIIFIAEPVASVAIKFGYPEYFSLMCLGMILVVYLAHQSVGKAMISAFIGLLLSWVGMDMITGVPRFTFGMIELNDGIGIIPLIMGIFGVSEVLITVEENVKMHVLKTKIKNLLPNFQDWKMSFWPMIRGAFLGFFLGVLPGGGPIISSFASYGLEKRLSKHPERFGTGEIAGVAGPETANNAASQGGFVTLLSLGIPTNPILTMLFAALVIHGVQPGPLLITEHSDIFWAIIASMFIGNVLLLFLNLPLIGIWVKVLKIPFWILFPLILTFCLIGSYSVSSSTLDLYLMCGFGVLGYIMRKFGFETAPLCLAYILGPLMERNLRQSLLLSNGNFAIFATRPISAVFWGITSLLLISMFIPSIKCRLKGL